MTTDRRSGVNYDYLITLGPVSGWDILTSAHLSFNMDVLERAKWARIGSEQLI